MSHLPASQHMAEPGMEDTVDGCHPMAESKSGHGLKGQRRGGADQCSLKLVRDPAEMCFPHLCLRQEPGREPDPPKQAQGDAKTRPGLAGACSGLKVQVTQSSVQSPRGRVRAGTHQADIPGHHTRQPHQARAIMFWRSLSSSHQSISSLLHFPFCSLVKCLLGKPYSIPTEQEKGPVPPRVDETLGKERGQHNLGGGTAL